MNPRAETVKDLERAGYALKRRGANHDILRKEAGLPKR